MRPPGAPGRLSLRLGLAAMAAAWSAMIVGPPLLHAAGHHTSAVLLRALFSPLCHQLPGRSFAIGGWPLAVCARCTGIYAGVLAGSVAAIAAAPVSRGRGGGHPLAAGRAPLLMAGLPSVVEFLAERTGLLQDAGPARALAGGVFGLVLVSYLLAAIQELPAELERELRRPAHAGGGSHAKTG